MGLLKLKLNAKDIVIAVKADSYITGQIDKSADVVKNAALAYNEQAGDDTYHEVKLYRTLRAAVSKFEANMIEYVDPGAGGDLSDDLTQQSTTFIIELPVGSRFLAAFANTLASLAQNYIINVMLYTWWQPIKPSLAKDYLAFAQEDLDYVRRGLSKTPPTTSSSYSDVTGTVDDIDYGSSGNSSSVLTSINTYDLTQDGSQAPVSAFIVPASDLSGAASVMVECSQQQVGFTVSRFIDDDEADYTNVGTALLQIADTPYMLTAADRASIDNSSGGNFVFMPDTNVSEGATLEITVGRAQ